MKLSLITVCRNSVATLSTALDSVLRQNGVDYEYWVIDGASTDGTVALLRDREPRFGGRLRWISEPDRGLYDAINKGMQALRERTADTTKIIVAQRISTIRDADQILVLDHGKIVGKGTHEELLKNCPEYLEIAQSQLSKEEIAHG